MCYGKPNYGALENTVKPRAHTPWGLHKDLHTFTKSLLTPAMPEAPQLPPPPQAGKAPDTSPLKRRNPNSGGFAVPSGGTLLSGPSGISAGALNLGSQTLLGGG